MNNEVKVKSTSDEKSQWFEVHPNKDSNRSSPLVFEYDKSKSDLQLSCYKGCSLKLDQEQIMELYIFLKGIV
ncbi:hypothetical protein KO02_12385 [Sphingobacterium sp. ML3W]|uniref:hypothetical protein n=1 Tax=Sphingobacterium sp. ML3W TaxID=1538644 RepID=UPI0004F68CD5|nr:hypothetical protein [Sphingobacterium sp. ML3W]AIM37399.1 hypothetical protein KO02_12385 [Sphingobacterium sp. ML3W]